MDKPVIVEVIADSTQTGAPRQVSFLLDGLKDQYDLHLIAPTGWLSEKAQQLGVPVHIFDDKAPRNDQISTISSYYQKLNPHIIHCHGVRGGFIGRVAIIKEGTKMVYTEHLWTEDFHLPNRLREYVQLTALKKLSQTTDMTVAVSEAVKRFFVNKQLVKADKITVIYGAIEPLAETSLPDEPIIGTLGYLTYVKGVKVLLRALSIIQESYPTVSCLIGGNGPELQSLQRLARMLNVDSHIQWLGSQSNPAEFLSKLQIYIQPSLSESFGMAALEAMSVGRPVVASRVGALPEIIHDQNNGLLFEKGDHEALAVAVCKLFDDSKLKKKLIVAGKETVNKFSVNELLERHTKLYNSLLK